MMSRNPIEKVFVCIDLFLFPVKIFKSFLATSPPAKPEKEKTPVGADVLSLICETKTFHAFPSQN